MALSEAQGNVNKAIHRVGRMKQGLTGTESDFRQARNTLSNLVGVLAIEIPPLLEGAKEDYERGYVKVGDVFKTYEETVIPNIAASGLRELPGAQAVCNEIDQLGHTSWTVRDQLRADFVLDKVFERAPAAVREYSGYLIGLRNSVDSSILAPDSILHEMASTLTEITAALRAYSKQIDS
jgi:hypothetical protein